MFTSLDSVHPNNIAYEEDGQKKPPTHARMTTLGNLVEEDFIVNDKIFATATPPQVMVSCPQQQTVWISYADGGIEVRNARTAEIIERFSSEGIGSDGSVLSSGVARRSVFFSHGRGVGVTGAPNHGEGGVFGGRPTSGGLGGPNSSLVGRRPGTGRSGSGAPPAHVVHSMVVVPAVVDAAVSGVSGFTLNADDACGAVESVWIGLSNGSIEVYSAVTNTFRFGLRKHVGPVYALAQFGGLVYSAGHDQRIAQWRVSDGRYVRLLNVAHGMHSGPIRCLHAEGNAVVSGSDDNTVKVWDVGSGELQLSGYFHSQSDGVLCLCRVGPNMWSGDRSGQIVVWSLRTCEAVRLMKPHDAAVLTLRRIGARVYTGSADGTMGVLDSASGVLLHKITDQSRGWVTALAWPSQLARFVVWSADTNGMVRCWYQDEYTAVTSDQDMFSEPTWYLSGSTPYREFRASLVRRNAQLREQLAVSEVRERSTMGLLRRCSRVFGGTGGGPGAGGSNGGGDIRFYTAKLKDQLRVAGERCDKAERDIEKRKEEIAQLERDMAATLQLLQSSRNELNMLSPGAVDRLAAILPAIPSEAYAVSGVTAPPPAPTTLSTTTTATTADPTTAPPPPAVGSVPGPAPAVPPPPSVGSVPGPAPAVPPPPPSSSVPLPPPPTAATLPAMAPPAPPETGAAAPISSTAVPQPPPPAAGGVPAPPPQPLTAGTATGYDYYAQLGILPPAATLTSNLASSGVAMPVTAATATTGLPITAAGSSVAALASAKATVDDRLYAGAQWTNPNVGNYIQRRYYGASPSLRTTDILKRERRRLRAPTVKVEPLKEEQRQRAGSRHSRSHSNCSSSHSKTTVEKSKAVSAAVATVSNATTTIATTTTTSTSATALPPPPPPPPPAPAPAPTL